jgi:hypothetical protein
MRTQGNPHQYQLSEIITMLFTNSATGVVEINGTTQIGRLYCRQGKVYHAEAGLADGLEAITELLSDNEATFRFIANAHHATETLWPDTQMLINYVRHQEFLRQRERSVPSIPNLEWVPELILPEHEGTVNIQFAWWPLLTAIDGQRSLQEIAQELQLSTLQINLLIREMISSGIVQLRPPQPAHAESGTSQTSIHASKYVDPLGKGKSQGKSESFSGFIEWLLTGNENSRSTGWPFRSRGIKNNIHS